jgi:hypothetical protein
MMSINHHKGSGLCGFENLKGGCQDLKFEVSETFKVSASCG